MKTVAKYLLLVSATTFLGYLLVGIGNWKSGFFDVVPAFVFTLGTLIAYLTFKLFRSKKLSESELERRGSPAILPLQALFCLATLYLLLRYGLLAILANGMMSFGNYSPMTEVEFFLMGIPVLAAVFYGITVWRYFPVLVWPLYALSVYISALLFIQAFDHPSRTERAIFMALYFLTWAFLVARIKIKDPTSRSDQDRDCASI